LEYRNTEIKRKIEGKPQKFTDRLWPTNWQCRCSWTSNYCTATTLRYLWIW